MEGGDTWEPGVGGGADTRESHADGEEAGTRESGASPLLCLSYLFLRAASLASISTAEESVSSSAN